MTIDELRQSVSAATPPEGLSQAVTALWYDVVPLVIMGIVLIPAGLWAFGRAERYAKRTGKLKRVG